MVELKIEDKIYKMPSGWNEVSIKKYIEIQNVESEGVKRIIEIISLLSECPISILYDISFDDLNQLDISWVSEEMKNNIEKTLVINNVKYGIIKDMKKLSLGEYVDLDHYIKDVNNNLHRIVAVLMRKVIDEDGELYTIEKYDSEKLEDRAVIFLEHMNVQQLFNISSFFLNLGIGFLENMKLS